MSQNSGRLVTVHAVRRTHRLKEWVSDHSSGSRAHEDVSSPATVPKNTLVPENNRSAPGECRVGQKSLAAPATYERMVAALTLRAGGRVLHVAVQACGSTESHMEVLSSERLTLEQWTRLCDKVQELTHSMILLDHPDD